MGEFREKGYLAPAMVNFLSLLGWNDGSEQEIFTQDELRDKFSLGRVNKSAAVFDVEKLVGHLRNKIATSVSLQSHIGSTSKEDDISLSVCPAFLVRLCIWTRGSRPHRS